MPHWSFPEMAHLPADHHHWHGSEFSGGYISLDNIVPQDLSNPYMVPPLIIPPPPHLYLDLELRGVNYISVQVPSPDPFSSGLSTLPETLPLPLMYPPMPIQVLKQIHM